MRERDGHGEVPQEKKQQADTTSRATEAWLGPSIVERLKQVGLEALPEVFRMEAEQAPIQAAQTIGRGITHVPNRSCATWAACIRRADSLRSAALPTGVIR